MGILADPRVARVIDLLGSRITITVSPEGIETTGLLMSRTTPWDRVQEVVLESRYDVFKDRVVTGSVALLLGRGLLPIPGLSWLLRGLLGLLDDLIPNSLEAGVRDDTGQALAGVRRSMARDVDLAGPLALVAFLSDGLTEAIVSEAARHEVDVTRPAADGHS